MSILFGLLLARRFYCRSALSLSPGRTGGLLPRINAPTNKIATLSNCDLVDGFFRRVHNSFKKNAASLNIKVFYLFSTADLTA